MIEIVPLLVAMAVLLVLSAFFSGSETALFALSPGQGFRLAQSHHRLGPILKRLLADPESLLITLLISNMVTNVLYYTLASVSTIKMGRAGEGAAVWLMAVGPLVVIVLAGEVLPKVLAYSSPFRVAPWVALPLFVVHQALRPIRRLLGPVVHPLTRLARPADHVDRTVSTDQLRELLDISERRGILHADETMMLQEIVGLGELKVRDVMISRVDMVAFDVDQPIERLHELFRRTRLARAPVYRGDLDHVLGWAYAKREFLAEDPASPLIDRLTPPHYAAELATVEQLLVEFRRDRIQSAIVVDEYGGTAGLVTLEDVVEEIVGEISDAQAPPQRPPVEQVAPAEYSVSGQLPIHDWAEAFGGQWDDDRLTTVGGLVFKLLGRPPHVGDRVRCGNIHFTVESMKGRRIDRLRLALDLSPDGGGKQP